RHTSFSRDWSSDVCSSDLYFDAEVSTTEFQVSTSLADAIGDRKLLIATAKRASTNDMSAFFVDAVGELALNGDHLSPSSIMTGQLGRAAWRARVRQRGGAG